MHEIKAIHTVPVDDLIEHDLSEDCACDPEVDRPSVYNDLLRPLVVHNSFDEREVAEAAGFAQSPGWKNVTDKGYTVTER